MGFESFENYTVKLLAKETKWTSLEARTHPTFIEIQEIYYLGPFKLYTFVLKPVKFRFR